MPVEKIEKYMVKDVLTASKEDTVMQMVERLHRHRIGAIVILDKDKFPIGIVSERDIIHAIVAYREKALAKQAQDIMSSPVLYLPPGEDIEAAAMLMALSRVRRIPVVKDHKLVGIISYRDLTNALRKSVKELEEKTEVLEDKANRDPLTGLHNRGYVEEQLQYHFELAKRTGNPMSVIMLDIDHFKKVNDTYGHQAGDHVLRSLAQILLHKSRAINIVGRYGGEEFIIIGPISDEKSSYYFAERLRAAIEEHEFHFPPHKFRLTISAGISVWNPKIEDAALLVKKADDALYASKQNGRNRVTLAETE